MTREKENKKKEKHFYSAIKFKCLVDVKRSFTGASTLLHPNLHPRRYILSEKEKI